MQIAYVGNEVNDRTKWRPNAHYNRYYPIAAPVYDCSKHKGEVLKREWPLDFYDDYYDENGCHVGQGSADCFNFANSDEGVCIGEYVYSGNSGSEKGTLIPPVDVEPNDFAPVQTVDVEVTSASGVTPAT